MQTQKLLITIVLIWGVLLIGCKKESDPPPTDKEILGDVVKPSIIDEYIYPIQPGTPEWAALTSYDEMLDACKLPDPLLQNISTWGLFATCINYPLYGDYSAFNHQATWINDLSHRFNGLSELFSRADAPVVLLYEYRYWDLNKNPSFLRRNYFELVIGCDASVLKMNKRQLLYLVAVALEKDKEQREYFNNTYPPYSVYIMANAMTHAGFKPFIDYCASQKDINLGEFMLWGFNASAEKIEEFAKEFVKN
jgi:hypothetical protein